MAQKDKVLKVSFGAFSCTLEGFDDPVETLKEVTEYFRALSASDPGFGDEPKLPDTENLARLVQQDDSKSVNIRTNESGSVMLRAEDAEFVPTETEDDDLSAPLSENDKRGAGTKKRRSATGSPAEGSVADKLQRIRAVVSSTEAEPSSDDLAEDDSQTARFFAGQIKETPPETATSEPEGASDDASASSDDASYRNGDDEILFSLGKIRTDPDDDTDAADDPAPQSESAQSAAEDADSPEEQTTETETNAAEPDPKDEADTPHDQLMKQIMNSLKGTGADQQAFPPDTARQDDSQPEASPKDDADSEDDFSQPYVLRPDQMISDGTDEDADPLPEASAPQIQKVQKSIPERDEVDLARLMAATEERMGAPETASQRETYSQLRAAAAANTGAGANGQGNDTEAAYHNDLASVVRPSRPTSGGAVRARAIRRHATASAGCRTTRFSQRRKRHCRACPTPARISGYGRPRSGPPLGRR